MATVNKSRQIGNLNFYINTHGLCKGKIVPVQTMRAYRGRRCVIPHVLKIGSRWKWMVNCRPQLLHSRLRNQTHIEQKDGWITEAVWTVLEMRKYLALGRYPSPEPSSPYLIAVPTSIPVAYTNVLRNIFFLHKLNVRNHKFILCSAPIWMQSLVFTPRDAATWIKW